MPELAAETPEPAIERPKPACERPGLTIERPEPVSERPEPASEKPGLASKGSQGGNTYIGMYKLYIGMDGRDIQIPPVFYRTSSPLVHTGAAALLT